MDDAIVGEIFRTRIDRRRVRETVRFLQTLLDAPGAAETAPEIEIDQDDARLAIATCLGLKDPKSPMKDEMYDAFTPHGTNLAVEGVCFRVGPHRRVEVYLHRRPQSDSRHHGELAVPGQALRITDVGPETALDRLTRLEFGVPVQYDFAGDVYVSNGIRGWYECKVFLATPHGDPMHGEWHAADPLPPDGTGFVMVPSHREQIIPLALRLWWDRSS